MAGDKPPRGPSDDVLDRLLRRANEPFASTVEEVGFAAAVRIFVRVARRIVESRPDERGEVAIKGIRDEGAIWLVGEDAERVRIETATRADLSHAERVALVSARAFAAIAYRHPFFDGNKRTGFVVALLVGRELGLAVRPTPFERLEAEVIELTRREAPDHEVAAWLLTEAFIRKETEV